MNKYDDISVVVDAMKALVAEFDVIILTGEQPKPASGGSSEPLIQEGFIIVDGVYLL